MVRTLCSHCQGPWFSPGWELSDASWWKIIIMATHSSFLAWKIPWREKPDRLQFTMLQRVGHDWVTNTHTHTHTQTYTHSLYDPNFTSVCTHKRHESRILKRYLYTHVHSSIICNSQRWKQSKGLSKDEWKSKIWYIHTIEYHSALRKKKGNSDTCYNMDNPWEHYAKWNKPVPKGKML